MQKHPTRLSISQVARTVDMSVQNLRKTYINKGKLSVSKDTGWSPYVDLSECLRVFPDRFKIGSQFTPVDNRTESLVDNQVATSFQELLEKNKVLETELILTSERLQREEGRRAEAERREEWLRGHVEKLTDQNLKLLSAPAGEKSGWIARIFGK